jgi:hypothetical protein
MEEQQKWIEITVAWIITSYQTCNRHFGAMCIKHHQCEQMKFHIIGVEGGIH